MSLNVDRAIVHLFFDRSAVTKSISRREARALAKIGSYIRRRARTDILRRSSRSGRVIRDERGRFKRSGSARPGEPPVVHSRSKFATLRNILYGLSSDKQSVLIGPVGVAKLKLSGSSRETVPELMEFGGTAPIDEYRIVDGRQADYWRAGRSAHPLAVHRKRRATYAAHPFMAPALEKEVKAGTVLDAFSMIRS